MTLRRRRYLLCTGNFAFQLKQTFHPTIWCTLFKWWCLTHYDMQTQNGITKPFIEIHTPGQLSSGFHLSSSSRFLSGLSWLRIPPSTLEVASVAIMTGWIRVGGTWRRTPPTAPAMPLCSCSAEATCTIVLAVSVMPCKARTSALSQCTTPSDPSESPVGLYNNTDLTPSGRPGCQPNLIRPKNSWLHKTFTRDECDIGVVRFTRSPK